MADELRLKVSQSDYQTKLAALDTKIKELASIHDSYAELQRDSYRVLGDNDTNLEKLRATVQKNMDAVAQAHAMLVESRAALEKQNEELGMTTVEIGNLFDTASGIIENKANSTFKIMGDL